MLMLPCRYEYQINFLEEKVRRLTSKTPPAPAATKTPATSSPDVVDVNQQFLNLLDTDTSVKFKEIEAKCKEMEEKKDEAEEKLKLEVLKNEELVKKDEEQKTALEQMEDLKKTNTELQDKLAVAVTNDMDLFMVDSAPEVDGAKDPKVVVKESDNEAAKQELSMKIEEKDVEIIMLKNEIDEKSMTSAEKELELAAEIKALQAEVESFKSRVDSSKSREEDASKSAFLQCGVSPVNLSSTTPRVKNGKLQVSVQEGHEVITEVAEKMEQEEKIKTVEKEQAEKEERYLLEMEQLKSENKRITEELQLVKEKGSMVEGGENKLDNEEMVKKTELAETNVKMMKLQEEKNEMDVKLKEQEAQIQGVKEREEELTRSQKEKSVLEKEVAGLKESGSLSQNQQIEHLVSELERTKVQLKEAQEGRQEAVVVPKEHQEVIETLNSLPSNKRKRLLENFQEETKKVRLEDEEESAVNASETGQKKPETDIPAKEARDEMEGPVKNVELEVNCTNVPEAESVTTEDLKERVDMEVEDGDSKKESSAPVEGQEKDVNDSVAPEALLAATPTSSSKAKPANILFCSWAKPEEKEETQVAFSLSYQADSS